MRSARHENHGDLHAASKVRRSTPGLPCTLVRTTGCDLRCGYCDSAFAFHGGKEMTLDEIMAEVARLGAPLVLLTGGEPMLQRELPALAARLLGGGLPGHDRDLGRASAGHAARTRWCAIIDVKTPGSGESHRNARGSCCASCGPGRGEVRARGRGRLPVGRARSSASTSWAVGRRCCCHPSMAGSTHKIWSTWMLRDRLPARLNLQLHKYVWEPDARAGVVRRSGRVAEDLGHLFGNTAKIRDMIFR